MDLYELSTAQSFASFHYNSRLNNSPYLKPIGYSTPSYFHRHSRRNVLPTVTSHGEVPQSTQKGIIFEWPQRRKFYSEKELCFFVWLIAHGLYWLHVLHILPSGAALGLNQPPWRYKPPLPKPENRDYIIEPDWDSYYM